MLQFDTYVVNLDSKLNKTLERLDYIGISNYIPLAIQPSSEEKFNLSPFTNSKYKDNFYFKQFQPHYEAWKLCTDKPLLIVESGALATVGIPGNVEELYNDILSFSHGESHYEPVIKNLQRKIKYSEKYLDYHNNCVKNSHAYMIKPHAVKKMLEFCRTRGWMLPYLMLNTIEFDVAYTDNKQFIKS